MGPVVMVDGGVLVQQQQQMSPMMQHQQMSPMVQHQQQMRQQELPVIPSPVLSPLSTPSSPDNTRNQRGKEMAERFKMQSTEKAILNFFTSEKARPEDRELLRKHSEEGGWIPLTHLLDLKSFNFPGHEVLRQAITSSDALEGPDESDRFRVRDEDVRKKFLAAH